jgi:hypothetical protein
MGDNRYFFGWTNIKWIMKEILNIYSSKKSFFSKKRIESGVGFIIAEWGMVYYLIYKIPTMTMVEFGMWATIQFFIAGYIIRQIQKEKIPYVEEENSDLDENENE